MSERNVVAAIPDLHFPFTDWKKLDRVYELIEAIQPDVVVQLGDVLDMYSQSKYARTQDLMTPQEELSEGIQAYQNFWATIQKVTSGKCRKVQLGGNHTDRVVKRATEACPSLLPFLDVEKHFKLKGVEVYMDSRHELEIDGVLYLHGWLSNSFAHAKYFNKPVVHGHLHSAGVFMENMRDGLLWSMSCGYLADKESVPLLYRATKTAKWVHGLGLVDSAGPRFINL